MASHRIIRQLTPTTVNQNNSVEIKTNGQSILTINRIAEGQIFHGRQCNLTPTSLDNHHHHHIHIHMMMMMEHSIAGRPQARCRRYFFAA